ncbi:tetratricopeptide repeat protein [Meiothermus cerbereus]|uniref:tetratricopeptide repeat protein n=1 Tax=Meiothermus cerbereus TaxID=65552 RepID=UPI003EEF1013
MAQLDAATGIERALKHLAKGEAAQALQVLDRVSWADLGWPEYWRVRAQAFLLLGDARQAAKCAWEGLLEDPDNLDLHVLRVRALLKAEEPLKAQEALNQALEVAPYNLELQALADSLEAQLEPNTQPPAPPAPMPTAQFLGNHARDDWRTARDRSQDRPLFGETEARAIRRAFNGSSQAHMGKGAGKTKGQGRSALWALVFVLAGFGLVLYWLWSQISG